MERSYLRASRNHLGISLFYNIIFFFSIEIREKVRNFIRARLLRRGLCYIEPGPLERFGIINMYISSYYL